MTLLFDQNLSRHLCIRLSDIYPDAQHVCMSGLENSSDQAIWDYAEKEKLIIVSKDGDFHQLSFLFGAPPKVVWLRTGNCSTDLAEEILRRDIKLIEDLANDNEAAILVLDP